VTWRGALEASRASRQQQQRAASNDVTLGPLPHDETHVNPSSSEKDRVP